MAPDGVSLNDLYEKVGEVGAIAREAKHAAQNTSAKVDALAVVVATQGHMREDVEDLKKEVKDLLQEKHRRDGAVGLIEWLARHWPFTILGTLIIVAVMWANGKVHL